MKPYEGYWYPKMGAIPALWAVYNIWDKNGYKMSEKSIEEYWYEENGQTIYGKAKNFLTDEEAASYTLENVLEVMVPMLLPVCGIRYRWWNRLLNR